MLHRNLADDSDGPGSVRSLVSGVDDSRLDVDDRPACPHRALFSFHLFVPLRRLVEGHFLDQSPGSDQFDRIDIDIRLAAVTVSVGGRCLDLHSS